MSKATITKTTFTLLLAAFFGLMFARSIVRGDSLLSIEEVTWVSGLLSLVFLSLTSYTAFTHRQDRGFMAYIAAIIICFFVPLLSGLILLETFHLGN